MKKFTGKLLIAGFASLLFVTPVLAEPSSEELKEDKKKVEKEISETKVSQQNSEEGAKKMNKILDLLLESDRDDIKGYIVEKYYEFHAKGYIDGYSLDCLERKYKIYSTKKYNQISIAKKKVIY